VGAAADLLIGQVARPGVDLADPDDPVEGEVDVEAGWRASQSWISGALCVP
jgi:hypothetical protein